MLMISALPLNRGFLLLIISKQTTVHFQNKKMLTATESIPNIFNEKLSNCIRPFLA